MNISPVKPLDCPAPGEPADKRQYAAMRQVATQNQTKNTTENHKQEQQGESKANKENKTRSTT